MTGFLGLILGCMFSGKTTALIDIYEQSQKEGKEVCVINYSGDTRYHDSMLSTHDKKMIPCAFASRLAELWVSHVITQIHVADVILINEGQFFPDLYEIVYSMVEEYGKTVYVCGLDGDFNRNKFGQLLDLIPLCDTVKKLRADCHICDNEGLFSHRITAEKGQVVIGSDNYIPLCRGCYKQGNLRFPLRPPPLP
jgi:thymidine kinase